VATQLATTFAVSLAAGLLLLSLAKWAGERFNFSDSPDTFASSEKKRSYLGGVGVALACVLGLAAGVGRPLGFELLLAAGTGLLILGILQQKTAAGKSRTGIWMAPQLALAAAAVWAGLAGGPAEPAKRLAAVALLIAAMSAHLRLSRMGTVAAALSAGGSLGVSAAAISTRQYGLAAAALGAGGAFLSFVAFNYTRPRVSLGRGGAAFGGFVSTALALQIRSTGPGSGALASLVLLGLPLMSTLVLCLCGITGVRSSGGATDALARAFTRVGLRNKSLILTYGLVPLAASGGLLVANALNQPRIATLVLGIFGLAGLVFAFLPAFRPGEGEPGGLRQAVMGVLVASVLALAAAAYPALAAAKDLQRAQAMLLAGRQSARSLDFAAARSSFSQARRSARSAGAKLGSPLTFGAKLIPVVRPNLLAAGDLAAGVSLLVPALQESLNASAALVETTAPAKRVFSKGRINLAPLQQAAGPLRRASAEVAVAVNQARQANGLLLPAVQSARGRFIREGDQLSAALAKLSGAAEVLPAIMGGQGDRTYFLMIQNGAEQRATGGFLGAFAILHARDGQLTLEKFDSNTALPAGEAAPSPSSEFSARYDRFGSRTAWYSVNMSPDFPTSARLVGELWQKRTGQKIDGVLAMDAPALAELLKATGPVSVPQLGEVNSDNFVKLTLNEAYIRFPENAQRTDLLVPVGREVWTKFLAADLK